jgi:hypothetical protein
MGEVLTSLPVKPMLSNIHKARCFLWGQNNPEVNYSPTRISGGNVSRGSITRKWEGVVGNGWSRLRIGTGGGHL